MIKVAVCDDDEGILNTVKAYFEAKFLEEVSVDYFDSGRDFLSVILNDKNIPYEIIITDIQMPGIGGIELGNSLRQRPDGDMPLIICISMFNDYYKELVGMGCFRFVSKPLEEEEFDDAVQRAIKVIRTRQNKDDHYRVFCFLASKYQQYVAAEKIVYLQSSGRVITMYVYQEGKLKVHDMFYMKLSEAMKKLDPDEFVHCARSYVVNLRHVSKITKDEIILKGEEERRIPISERKEVETRHKYLNYVASHP